MPTRNRCRPRGVLNRSPARGAARISPCLCSVSGMPFATLPSDPATHYLDVHMMGVEGFGAVYLIDEEQKAIVEAGTSNDARAILAAVREFGLRPADIDHLIVSHVHLDHAGGAGFLLKEMTNATVYVHERGLKHLANPSKLVASAASALGDMADEFGTMTPIAQDRLHAVRDQEALDLGGRILRFLDSPGHAPHELTVLDEKNRCVYTGDAAGLYFPRDEILIPITPTPAFDLEQNLATFRRILELKPRALLFSHFGPHVRPEEAIRKQLVQYPAWSEIVRRYLGARGEDRVTDELFRLTCAAAKAYPHEFLRRRIRNSVHGLGVYHERMEHAARVR